MAPIALCYGHKSSTGTYGYKSSTGTVRRLFHQKSYDSTTPVRRPPGGRKNRAIFDHFLDIVRCPVKLRYYLKFHGARTAFGGSLRVKWHRPVIVRFLFNLYVAGHRTMSDKCQELKKSLNKSTDARPGTGRCFMSRIEISEKRCFCRSTYCTYIDISLLKTAFINTKICMLLEQLMMINIQQTSATFVFNFLQSWASVVFITITVRVSLNLSFFIQPVSLEEWWRNLMFINEIIILHV